MLHYAVLVLLTVFLRLGVMAQEKLKSLDPQKARLNYSFPLRPGAETFRFHVELDKTSKITGVSVFRGNDSRPFQTLPACKAAPSMELNEYDNERDLLKHADLNFDGFEDVQLVQDYLPHLAKSVYCIYTWDDKKGRFRYEPALPMVDPIPHPVDKTITVHEDWQGDVYSDRTYRWKAAKVELMEENGRVYGSESPQCGSTDYCSRLIHGKMVITIERPSGCPDKPDFPLVCPSDPPIHSQTRKKLRPKKIY